MIRALRDEVIVKPVLNCIECIHLKVKPGWKYAYCAVGQILNSKNEPKLFKWKYKQNKGRSRYLIRNLYVRGGRYKTLQGCGMFE